MWKPPLGLYDVLILDGECSPLVVKLCFCQFFEMGVNIGVCARWSEHWSLKKKCVDPKRWGC